jgi:hypothetical protein
MTDSFRREIERLLDEPGERPVTGQASDQLRSRLNATFSEGLDGAASASSDLDAGGPASIAAFIDGQLTGAARDKLVAALAQQHSLRAEVEAAAELVQSVAESPLQVPKHVLARANAQFAPAPPAQARSWALFDLSVILPRQRIAWVMVAALLLVVAVPAGLMIGGRFGQQGGVEPELSSVEPSGDAAQKKKACEEKLKEKAKDEKSKPASSLPAAPSPSAELKDPCDPSTLKPDNGVRK